MPRKRVTFIVIPPNDGPVREYRFSSRLPWISGLVGLCFIAALSYYSAGYYRRVDQQQAMEWLRQENGELMRHLKLTEKSVGRLETAMGELIEVDEKLRSWHEMELVTQEERGVGMGGPEIPQDYDVVVFSALPSSKRRELEKLNARITRLQLLTRYQDDSFDRIRQKFLASGDSLSHIPTIFPVPRDQAWISSRFAYRPDPFTGRKAFHTGIDFAGRKGTSILATADGMVTHAYLDRRLGNVIVVEHDIEGRDDNGDVYHREGIYRTEYGHLEKMLVKKGDRVKRGDNIGVMGNTGRSTGPHLHYAVRYQDRSKGRYKGYVNPEEFLLDIPSRDEREVASWLRPEN